MLDTCPGLFVSKPEAGVLFGNRLDVLELDLLELDLELVLDLLELLSIYNIYKYKYVNFMIK